jgi:hypothetical protein
MANPKTGATLDWTTEENYWRNNYTSRPYVRANADADFDYWSPAYRYGYDAAQRFQGHRWDEVESDLRSGWDQYEHRGSARTTWEQIKDAVRDGWDRIVGNR